MYGIVLDYTKSGNDTIIEQLQSNLDKYISYAEAQLSRWNNVHNGVGGDLVHDLFLKLKTKSEEVQGVATSTDADRIIRDLIKKMSKNDEYGFCGKKKTVARFLEDEEGHMLEDEEHFGVYDDYSGLNKRDYEQAVEFRVDLLNKEDRAGMSEEVMSKLLMIAKEMGVVEAQMKMASGEEVKKLQRKTAQLVEIAKSYVKSKLGMDAKDCSDEYIDAFKAIFRTRASEANRN